MSSGERPSLPMVCPGRSCRDRLLRWARQRVEDPDDAEDLVGEVCLHCLRGMARFRGEAEFSTWLHRIARNVLSDYYSAKARQARAEADREDAHRTAARLASPPSAGPVEGAHVRAALYRLTPRQRHLVEWKYGDGLSYAEIAARLRISEAAASQALYRARLAFRKAFEAERGDDSAG